MPADSASLRPPQIDELLELPEIAAFFPSISRPLAAEAVSLAVSEARKRTLSGGGAAAEGEIVAEAARACAELAARRLRRVLNGTGLLLHGDQGRSPVEAPSWDAARAVNVGYCNLELDLASGSRGPRGGLVPLLAAKLAGAEAAIALNNGAASLLLALSAIAAGREVLVSRGEQVQIGGGFRIPEILALSGASLVEVGTTNVTTVQDYLRAIGPETACVLVVRASNFAIRGFADRPGLARLAAALPPGLPLVVDQGSGCHRGGGNGEEPLESLIRDGASLVCFSGDKLLGGPQAGIAAGRMDLIARLAAHPLARALRPGKTVLSLLEDRLVRALNGEEGKAALPDPEELESFGKRITRKLPARAFRLVDSVATTGGGSSPDEGYPSRALELLPEAAALAGGAERFRSLLRMGDPPFIAAIRDGTLLVDLSGLVGEEPAEIAALLAAPLPPAAGPEDAAGSGAAPPGTAPRAARRKPRRAASKKARPAASAREIPVETPVEPPGQPRDDAGGPQDQPQDQPQELGLFIRARDIDLAAKRGGPAVE